MMVVMAPRCKDCGAECTYVRSRFEIAYPGGALIADEVPSVRCQACGRTACAAHALPQVKAVLELVQEVSALAHKDFTALALRPQHETT